MPTSQRWEFDPFHTQAAHSLRLRENCSGYFAAYRRLGTLVGIATLLLLGSVGCQIFQPPEPVSPPAPLSVPEDRFQHVQQVQYTEPVDKLSDREQVAVPLPAGAIPHALAVDPAPRAFSELQKVSLDTYRVEPPDVLLIDAVRLIPRAPYSLQPLDFIQIVVIGTHPDQPIAAVYQIEPSGVVNLGPAYGAVRITGMTIVEAADAIAQHLRGILANPEVSVSLVQVAGQQQIVGEHLVGPDGTVNLGIYGGVYVAGMTLSEARAVIEQHLSRFLHEPQVSVDVFAYNSKVYYIIFEGAAFGDQVIRLPITGNETVLDAIAQIGGIGRASSRKIWIARPTPHGHECDQILPVDWAAITKRGATGTNYQLLPGDRIFVAEDRLIALDGFLSKVITPFERIAGTTLLWSQTIQVIRRFPRGTFQNF